MSIQSAELTCDGLAYLYHSYNPIVIKNERDSEKFGRGTYEFLVNAERKETTLSCPNKRLDFFACVLTAKSARKLTSA